MSKKKKTPIDWYKNDFVTCALLNYNKPDDPNLTDVYHFVYASQLYGTLFGIYAKFTTSPSPPGGPTTDVTHVYLELLNYEGVVNIGFTGVPYFCPKSLRKNETDTIFFGVQAGIVNPSIDFDINIKLSQGKHTRLKFVRFLYPMVDYMFKKNIRDKQVPDKALKTQTTPSQMPDSVFFDTEFQTRSGVDYFNRVLRQGLAEDPDLSVKDLAINYLKKLITIRCTESNVNLLYH